MVYRVDTRPPSVIFNIGFENLGSNTDLVQHVLGYGDSAFVATSEDLNATMRIARASILWHSSAIRSAWIYTHKNFVHSLSF